MPFYGQRLDESVYRVQITSRQRHCRRRHIALLTATVYNLVDVVTPAGITLRSMSVPDANDATIYRGDQALKMLDRY